MISNVLITDNLLGGKYISQKTFLFIQYKLLVRA